MLLAIWVNDSLPQYTIPNTCIINSSRLHKSITCLHYLAFYNVFKLQKPNEQPLGRTPPITQAKKNNTLQIRAYLDQTVIPIVLKALTEMTQKRPDNPIEFVANYLLKNNPEDVEAQRKE